jgi:molybdenum cofactor cytidylyltransferase
VDEQAERTTALVMAADRGRDFDGPKYLASCRGRPLLQTVLDEIDAWPVDDVVVVLGDQAEPILDTVRFGDALVVIDPEWSEGAAASLRVGLDTLAREQLLGPCVIARGDQIGVRPDLVQRLLDAHAAERAVATVPKYRYARGWPIVVAERLWPRLMGLEGRVDVLDVLSSHPEGVVEVWFDSLSPTLVGGIEDLPRSGRR